MEVVKTEKAVRRTIIKKKHKVLIGIFIILAMITNIVGLYIGNIYYQKVCKLNVNPETTGI